MKKAITIISILTLYFLVRNPLYSQELNFNDFLNSAINNSYKLKASKIDSEISKKGIKEARADYFPSIGGYAVTERYNDLSDGKRQITAVGNEIMLNRDYFQDAVGATLNYNIFDFGTRKRNLEIAKADNKQKEILLLKNTRDLKLDIVELYGETLNLYKQIQIKNEIINLTKELNNINQRLRKAGEISEIEVVDSEIKISEIEGEIIEHNNNLAKRLTEVSYYTDKDYKTDDIEVKDFETSSDNILLYENGIIKLSAEKIELDIDNSYEAISYDLEILKKKKELEIQKRANLPKFSFNTRYNLYGSDDNNFFDSFRDIEQRGLTFRISTSFTVFDGLKNINTVQKKKLELERIQIQKEDELAQLKKKYEQMQLDAKNSLLQEENNKKTLELVNKNLDMLKRLNIQGEIPKAECIKKQLELLEKKQKLEENRIRNFVAGYKLKVLSKEVQKL